MIMGKRQKVQKCPYCGKVFKDVDKFVAHLQEHHRNDGYRRSRGRR